MRKPAILFIILLVCLKAYAQDYIAGIYLKQTFFIKEGSKTGTAFVGRSKGKYYLITAKHLFDPKDKVVFLDVFWNGRWARQLFNVYFNANSKVDAAVLTGAFLKDANWGIDLDFSLSTTLGDEGFFLGFPYGMYTETDSSYYNNGFPLPLVKKAFHFNRENAPIISGELWNYIVYTHKIFA